jgi:hypothetical protein
MKKYRLFIFLLVSILLMSCSLTSRKYMPGYSINWLNNSKSVMVGSHNHIPDIVPKCISISSRLHNDKKIDDSLLFVKKKNQIAKQKNVSVTNNSLSIEQRAAGTFEKRSFSKIGYMLLDSDTAKKQDAEPVLLPKARSSLLFGILSWFIIFILLILIFFLIFPLTNGVFYLTVLASSTAAIIGLIMGIKAININNRYPHKYYGISKAIVGIIFSAILLIAAIVLFAQWHF